MAVTGTAACRDLVEPIVSVSADGTLICGDGGDPGQVARAPNGQWIYLFRPARVRGSHGMRSKTSRLRLSATSSSAPPSSRPGHRSS